VTGQSALMKKSNDESKYTVCLVPRAGVEPARPFGQRILSPQRLPFRHPGTWTKFHVLENYASFPSISPAGKNASPAVPEFYHLSRQFSQLRDRRAPKKGLYGLRQFLLSGSPLRLSAPASNSFSDRGHNAEYEGKIAAQRNCHGSRAVGFVSLT
jgi:hypothetical protein